MSLTLAGALAPLLAAEAQTARTYFIVCVALGKETDGHKSQIQTFRAAMRDLGYVEGKNLTAVAGVSARNHRHGPVLRRCACGSIVPHGSV